jgi:DNA polymerase-3 subunit alpha
MSYRLIEQRPDQHETPAEVGGRTYPVPSIVEDDDGLRLLLTRNLWVPVDLWTWASASGAVALINVERMLYVLASDFAEHHTENPKMRGLVLAENHWHPYRPGMTYLEMAGVQHTDRQDAALAAQGLAEEDLEDLGEFVHLHTHSEYSPLDGVTGLDDMMKIIVDDGQRAIAVTDHGNVAAHPALQLAADKAGVRPIFGMEANFVDDRTVKGAEVRGAYWHLVLWAMNDTGLRNLWAMSTEGYGEEAFYARPRIDWDTLERHAEGVMVSTACERGPVAQPFLDGNEERALANLGRLQQIFGDRLYVEIHTNGRAETRRANEWLVKISEDRNLPMVAVVDSHYGRACDQHTHRVWLSVQTNDDVSDDNGLFGGGHDYHLMTAQEVREALSYLPGPVVAEAMHNTVRVARRCTAKIEPQVHQPVYSKPTDEWPDPVAHDVDRLWAMVMDRWADRVPTNRDQDAYLARVDREMTLLVKKGFCGYYLMEADLVNWAKDHGILVGPGRGSGGGSLIAFITRITEIDPVEHELLFERFLTEGRNSPPDFDIDFPSSKKSELFDYVAERWGAENMAIVGTHLRLKSKGILNDISRALKSTLPEDYYVDFRKIAEIVSEAEAGTAGLGMSWEDLWIQHGDQLDPYREKYPEVFRYADELHGKLKTFGTHPAGVIISTEGSIVDSLPLRRGAEGGPMVCQFDMEALDRLGYVKFDLLNLRTLDTLQMCVDLIKETTGEWVDPYGWRHDEQYADPQIFDEISAGWTLGIFQIETQSGTRLTRRFQPQTVAELADVITLVRPGPMRSGLTETYFRRRNGEEEVNVPDPRLEPVLVKTNGCMLYQEDIMRICMELAGYDSNEADEVRKILGKKKVDKVAAAGSLFETRAVENGTDPMVAHLLWEQMAEFAKYSFNRAHAFAYAILGMWTAWFKFHYPIQFLCAALSTVKEERIAEFVEEARRMGYSIQPPDINESKAGFTASAMAVRYGFLSIKGIGESASDAILAGQPYTGWEDFLERKTSKCNSGHVQLLAQIGAFDSLVPNRRWLLKLLEIDKIAGSDRCQHKTNEPVLITGQLSVGEPPEPETQLLPCAYDWPSEPREPSRQAGRFKKAKPLPKKCFRGCRQFTPTAPPTSEEVAPFTDEDIRRIEIDTLGVFLSSTPFDRIPEEDRAACSTAVEVLSAEPGEYIVPALIRTVRRTKDRHDRDMAFVKLATERGELEAVVFSGEYARYHKMLTAGRLVFAAVKKTYRGCNLTLLEDLDTSTAKQGEDHQ